MPPSIETRIIGPSRYQMPLSPTSVTISPPQPPPRTDSSTVINRPVFFTEFRGIARERDRVCHAQHEWARDDDGDGFCEVHCNTTQGLWTDVRNFLRPFNGVHKMNLAGYIALCEFRRNLKRISPAFIAALVAFHSFYP